MFWPAASGGSNSMQTAGNQRFARTIRLHELRESNFDLVYASNLSVLSFQSVLLSAHVCTYPGVGDVLIIAIW